ncbi:MAG: HypC/HybG/HupF family hydrogenase formation chaperone [Bacteroidales bacterium]|nr:HypC/HybG/HupF family hydrogenase formation chaperone [Bacteroidales bacterium]
MCLSIPARIEKINGPKAHVSVGGNRYQADISLISEAAVGDYVLLHAGFGIQKISEQHALETLELIDEMNRAKKGK